MSSIRIIREMGRMLRILGQPDRLLILLAIGEGEACVCHLKTTLKKRQAFISQHLMAMRDADILETRRDGRYIFYQVKDKRIFDLLRLASNLVDKQAESVLQINSGEKVSGCECPICSGVGNPQPVLVEEKTI